LICNVYIFFGLKGQTLSRFTSAEVAPPQTRRGRLPTSGFSAGGAVAVGVLTPEDYAAEGCDSTDSENFVDLARSVRGCELAAFVRRVRPDGKVNVSLRCHPPHDAAALCAEWGGGGHAAAAGATLDGPLEDAVRLVTARLDAAAR